MHYNVVSCFSLAFNLLADVGLGAFDVISCPKWLGKIGEMYFFRRGGVTWVKVWNRFLSLIRFTVNSHNWDSFQVWISKQFGHEWRTYRLENVKSSLQFQTRNSSDAKGAEELRMRLSVMWVNYLKLVVKPKAWLICPGPWIRCVSCTRSHIVGRTLAGFYCPLK